MLGGSSRVAPLSLPGPRSLRKVEAQYGKADRIWVMDRGIPTDEMLAEMRQADQPLSFWLAIGPFRRRKRYIDGDSDAQRRLVSLIWGVYS